MTIKESLCQLKHLPWFIQRSLVILFLQNGLNQHNKRHARIYFTHLFVVLMILSLAFSLCIRLKLHFIYNIFVYLTLTFSHLLCLHIFFTGSPPPTPSDQSPPACLRATFDCWLPVPPQPHAIYRIE